MADYPPNPYDFVPLENVEPPRGAWHNAGIGLDRLLPERYTGRLACVLHPETPIFIHGEGQQQQQSRRFFRLGGRPGVPASSLKGAIRSTFEIVSDSCLSSLSDEYKVSDSHQRTYGGAIDRAEFIRQHPVYRPNRIVPQLYLPCTSLDLACPACLLFGMVERLTDIGQEGTPLAGRLFFSDATPVKGTAKPVKVEIPPAGGGPHPWHATFYFQNQGRGEILGRKLYYHHKDYKETLAGYRAGLRADPVALDAQMGQFEFTIDFTNLAEQELAYLVYALALEPDIRHHMFYGKPYGLGAARIEIRTLALRYGPNIDGGVQFLAFDPPPLPPTAIADWSARGLQQWRARNGYAPAYEAFKRLLHWPGAALYKYPGFDWFRRIPGSGAVTLAEYQAGNRTPSATAGRPPGQAPRPAPTQPTTQAASTSAGSRQRGKVKKFFDDKGFGFIERPGQPDLFVHRNDVRGRLLLAPGQTVSFVVGQGQKGDAAKDVEIVGEEKRHE